MSFVTTFRKRWQRDPSLIVPLADARSARIALVAADFVVTRGPKSVSPRFFSARRRARSENSSVDSDPITINKLITF